MNSSNILIWIVIAVIVLGGGYWFLGGQSSSTNDTMTPKDSELSTGQVEDDMKEGEMMEKDEGAMMEERGTYQSYSPEKLALASDGKVVLHFHADWCLICRNLEAEILANPAGIPSGVHILKVEYDSATELKQKYGVTYQHTFVQVDAAGNLLAKWGDATTLMQVLAKVK